MIITLVGVFISVALVAGLAVSSVLSSTSAERRRLRAVTRAPDSLPLPETLPLSGDSHADGWQSMAPLLGLSGKDFNRLRTRLIRAGYSHPSSPIVYTALERIAPLIAAAIPLLLSTGTSA